MKTYKFRVNSRVNLFMNNKGFIFTTEDKKPSQHFFRKWSEWQDYVYLYRSDNIYKNLCNYLDNTFPQNNRPDFYYNINF